MSAIKAERVFADKAGRGWIFTGVVSFDLPLAVLFIDNNGNEVWVKVTISD
jgi:hypothetical protein